MSFIELTNDAEDLCCILHQLVFNLPKARPAVACIYGTLLQLKHDWLLIYCLEYLVISLDRLYIPFDDFIVLLRDFLICKGPGARPVHIPVDELLLTSFLNQDLFD